MTGALVHVTITGSRGSRGSTCSTFARHLRIAALAFVALALFVAPARADDMKIAKGVIAKQLGYIKAANVAKLKAGFTARLQDRITEENVKKAQKEVGSMTIGDLVADVLPSEGRIKIKMKNGRTLTTLVKVDGTWLADTVWFK